MNPCEICTYEDFLKKSEHTTNAVMEEYKAYITIAVHKALGLTVCDTCKFHKKEEFSGMCYDCSDVLCNWEPK